jgi:hypothetical protein
MEIQLHELPSAPDGVNFDQLKSEGLHKKHATATWNMAINLSVCLKTERNQEV